LYVAGIGVKLDEIKVARREAIEHVVGERDVAIAASCCIERAIVARSVRKGIVTDRVVAVAGRELNL
jgi:hypothetical protein